MSTVRVDGKDVALEGGGGLRCLVKAMGFVDSHRVRPGAELVMSIASMKPAPAKPADGVTVIETANGDRRVLPKWLVLSTPEARKKIADDVANAAQRMYDAAIQSSGSAGARRKKAWREAIQGADMQTIREGNVEKKPLPREAQAAIDSSGDKSAKKKAAELKQAAQQPYIEDLGGDLV